MVLDALRDLCPGGQCSGHFPVPSFKPYFDQRSRRDPQPLPRVWADPALDFSIFEPAGGHPEEVRGSEDHSELEEAQSNQQSTPSSDRISIRTRRRTARAAGMHPLLSTLALGPAGPLDPLLGVLTPRREFHGRGRPRPPPRPRLLPLRRSPRHQYCPTATARNL